MAQYYLHTWDERMRVPEDNPCALERDYHRAYTNEGNKLVEIEVPTDLELVRADGYYTSEGEKWFSFFEQFQYDMDANKNLFHDLMTSPGDFKQFEKLECKEERVLFADLEKTVIKSLPPDTVLYNPSVGTVSRCIFLKREFHFHFSTNDPYFNKVRSIIVEHQWTMPEIVNLADRWLYVGFSANHLPPEIFDVAYNVVGFGLKHEFMHIMTPYVSTMVSDGFVGLYKGSYKFFKYLHDKFSYSSLSHYSDLPIAKALVYVYKRRTQLHYRFEHPYLTKKVSYLMPFMFCDIYCYSGKVQDRYQYDPVRKLNVLCGAKGEIIDYSGPGSFLTRQRYLSSLHVSSLQHFTKLTGFEEIFPPYLLVTDVSRYVIIVQPQVYVSGVMIKLSGISDYRYENSELKVQGAVPFFIKIRSEKEGFFSIDIDNIFVDMNDSLFYFDNSEGTKNYRRKKKHKVEAGCFRHMGECYVLVDNQYDTHSVSWINDGAFVKAQYSTGLFV